MQKTHTLDTLYCERTAASSNDIPWHFTVRRTEFRYCSRRSANGEESIEIGSEESQQEGLIWPLHEGREIWGADGAFASIRYDVRTSRSVSVPSANELAWFCTGFRQSARPGAFRKRVSFTQRRVYLWKRTLNKVIILHHIIIIKKNAIIKVNNAPGSPFRRANIAPQW